MLLINTKENQTITIAEEYELTLLDVNYCNGATSSIRFRFGDQKKDRYLLRGHTVQLLEQVTLTLTKVVWGREKVAVLGFDAPRVISIRGEWTSQGRS